MLRLLGQIMLAAIFIKGGAEAFAQPGGRVKMVADANLPAILPKSQDCGRIKWCGNGGWRKYVGVGYRAQAGGSRIDCQFGTDNACRTRLLEIRGRGRA